MINLSNITHTITLMRNTLLQAMNDNILNTPEHCIDIENEEDRAEVTDSLNDGQALYVYCVGVNSKGKIWFQAEEEDGNVVGRNLTDHWFSLEDLCTIADAINAQISK